MNYNSKTPKGVKDRSYTPIKIPFHKENTYQQALEKAKIVWKGTSKSNFFLADGTGSSIYCENFTLDMPDGSTETLPWTLSNYLRVSCIRYPSRARIYCVYKELDGKIKVCSHFVVI